MRTTLGSDRKKGDRGKKMHCKMTKRHLRTSQENLPRDCPHHFCTEGLQTDKKVLTLSTGGLV